MSGRILVLSSIVLDAFAIQSQKRDFTNDRVTIASRSVAIFQYLAFMTKKSMNLPLNTEKMLGE